MSSVLDKLRNRNSNDMGHDPVVDVYEENVRREPLMREDDRRNFVRGESVIRENTVMEPSRMDNGHFNEQSRVSSNMRGYSNDNINVNDPRRYPNEVVGGHNVSPREIDNRYVQREVATEVITDRSYDRVHDRNYSNRARNLPVDRVPAPTELAYSNPDKFGLQILGLNSGDTVRLVKPAALDIEPIVLHNVADTTGKISKKLFEMMFKYGVTVLPLRECGVFESVVSVDGFKILEYKGKKYASYCGTDYPITYRDKLYNRILEKLYCALPYGLEEEDGAINSYIWNKEESRLSRIANIGGKDVEVPSLCVSEIEYIHTKLQLCSCNILEVRNDFPHIIVGIDLEGVDLNEGEGSY